MKRRSFFRRLASIAAVIALAPEIAFRAKLELPSSHEQIFCGWDPAEGNSITRAAVVSLTPKQLEELFKPAAGFSDMEEKFLHEFEVRACASDRSGLYDFLNGRGGRI